METTERQKQILNFMRAFHSKEGFPPSIREICKGLGLVSPGSLIKHLRALEAKGFITCETGKKRAWKLNEPLFNRTVPLVGRIAAGTPILASENKEGELPVDPGLFGSENVFALRVNGDSMIEAQIRNGDLAILKPQVTAENGDIVAVMIHGIEPEATLKFFYKYDEFIELRPANTAYAPLKISKEDQADVVVLGKLVGIIRSKL